MFGALYMYNFKLRSFNFSNFAVNAGRPPRDICLDAASEERRCICVNLLSPFCPRGQGGRGVINVHSCPLEGGGVKIGQNLFHVVVEWPLNIFQTLQWTLDVHPVIFVWTLPQRNADVFASILVETHRVRVTNEFVELAVILAYKNSHLIKCPNMFKV